jgi:hypothetical protein
MQLGDEIKPEAIHDGDALERIDRVYAGARVIMKSRSATLAAASTSGSRAKRETHGRAQSSPTEGQSFRDL